MSRNNTCPDGVIEEAKLRQLEQMDIFPHNVGDSVEVILASEFCSDRKHRKAVDQL